MVNLVNDFHSNLNLTKVSNVVYVKSKEDIIEIVLSARRGGKSISVSGGRHSMGGQQFGSNMILVDITKMNKILNFNIKTGIIEVEAGIMWPKLMNFLSKNQENYWGIRQKQTGADNFTLGGTISANAHGRGLNMKPIISDIESFSIILSDGKEVICNRKNNFDLFRLVIGGYGLFGIIYSIKLRLSRRIKVQRTVEIVDIEKMPLLFEQKQKHGFIFGDFQFSVDEECSEFLSKGVFSTYLPVKNKTNVTEKPLHLRKKDWKDLVFMAHTDKSTAFKLYAKYYRSTNGQVYWSDTHQRNIYVKDYHKELDKKMMSSVPATEIITEIYVPNKSLIDFMKHARNYFKKNKVNVIYGTIRVIKMDDESFLKWAKKDYLCIVFNLHTQHTQKGIDKTTKAFRKLIDLAIKYNGNVSLMYHKFATKRQMHHCYPEFKSFLLLKKQYDPLETFQSNWYLHYKKMFK